MNIVIFGHSDKRHLIYSMVRMLKFTGRVCLITNNPVYRQLSMDFEEMFTISDVQVIVEDDPDSVEEYHDLSLYDYIIYDCLLSMPQKLDVAIILDHFQVYEQFMDENEIPEIPTFVPKNAKVTNNTYKRFVLVPASTLEPQLQKIEESYKFLPILNSAHNKSVATLLETITHIPKSKLLATLKQKGDDIK